MRRIASSLSRLERVVFSAQLNIRPLGVRLFRTSVPARQDATGSPFDVFRNTLEKMKEQAKEKVAEKPREITITIRQLHCSYKKINPYLKLLRGMSYHDAIAQLTFSRSQKFAPMLKNIINSARHSGEHNYGLNPDKLVISTIYCTKGTYLKRIRYHAKSRFGIMLRRRTHITVTLREVSSDKELRLKWKSPKNRAKIMRELQQAKTPTTTAPPREH